jgi:hypothetical protein
MPSEYLLYFALTFALSTFFAMGGVGSAIALVPLLDMFGVALNLAKLTALFVNTATTVTATFMNFKRGVLNMRFAFPLVVSSLLSAPVGVQMSRYIDENTVRLLLMLFLLLSATMMFFSKKEATIRYESQWVMYAGGGIVGLASGVLGVGGGSLIMPLMILLGFDAKKMAVAVSFMLPFSTLSAFLSYASFVSIDYWLLLCCAVAAVLGGYAGNHIMHFRLSSKQIKKIIGLILYLLAIKIGFDLFFQL